MNRDILLQKTPDCKLQIWQGVWKIIEKIRKFAEISEFRIFYDRN